MTRRSPGSGSSSDHSSSLAMLADAALAAMLAAAVASAVCAPPAASSVRAAGKWKRRRPIARTRDQFDAPQPDEPAARTSTLAARTPCQRAPPHAHTRPLAHADTECGARALACVARTHACMC